MSQELEIEFKNMLTKEEFIRLMNIYEPYGNKAVQTNYYFDTNEMQLKRNKCALRIRRKGSHFVLTLKEPHPEGHLETHQNIRQSQF
ncbi:MAG: CYTH domain-containing protein, partial [Bacillus sp. (in: Bacteria)]|nr:CYTH domain-containing protein [Bacillus sp. (in: firmicutes)]